MVPGTPAAFPRSAPSSASVPPGDDRTAQPSGLRKLRTKRCVWSHYLVGSPCRRQGAVPGPALLEVRHRPPDPCDGLPGHPREPAAGGRAEAHPHLRPDLPGIRPEQTTSPSGQEFRQLREELRTDIRRWIDENGVPGYRSPARKEPSPRPVFPTAAIPKTQQERKQFIHLIP